jgi:hypothetical protein
MSVLIGRVHRKQFVPLVAWAVCGLLGNAAPLGAQAQDSVASVRGWVVEHETGASVEGATVSLEPLSGDGTTAETQISGSGGVFVFVAVTPGRYLLSVTLLGYTALSDTLSVAYDTDVELTLPLSVSPVPLDPVVVVVRRRPIGPLEAFERRRLTQRGTFLTRSDIQASNSAEFTDLLRPIPGVRLVPTATLGYEVYFRGGCTPDLWMDGAHVGSTTDIDSFIRPEDLDAVEVYRGPDLPGEFGTNLCGAIVAWTRRSERSTEKRSLRQQLIFAGSFVLLAVFLGR